MTNEPHAPDEVPTDTIVRDLRHGDHLVTLGEVGFAAYGNPDAAPVIVADTHSTSDEDDAAVEISTSLGSLYATQGTPAQVHRLTGPTPVLLISRRQALASRLMEYGVPITRRTPLKDESAPAVTVDEWNRASLIVIDGYLGQETIRALWAKGVPDRSCIVIVGTDPDDVRLDGRSRAARARRQWVLPYEEQSLIALLHAAHHRGDPDSHGPTDPFSANGDPFLGVLLDPRA